MINDGGIATCLEAKSRIGSVARADRRLVFRVAAICRRAYLSLLRKRHDHGDRGWPGIQNTGGKPPPRRLDGIAGRDGQFSHSTNANKPVPDRESEWRAEVIEMVHRRSWVSVMRRLDHRVGIELGRTISGRLQKWKVIRSFVFVCCASIGWINGIGCAGGSPPHAKKWGSPTDGVQAALRGDGYFWNSKSTPRFYASIRKLR